MKPMLAHTYSESKLVFPCAVQPKLNGIRALYQNGLFTSRDEIPWNPAILYHISSELYPFLPSDVILDGELYLHGLPLQQINSAIAVKRQTITPDTKRIQYHVFDCVSSDTFFNRAKFISTHLRDLKHTKIVPTHLCRNTSEIDHLFSYYKSRDYEGIIYRHLSAPYVHSRTHYLLKRKAWLDGEFPIIGIEEGEGRCASTLGALICSIPGFPHLSFKVGTGFDDATRLSFFTHPPIGRHAKIQFLYFSDDHIPQNTSFIHLV